MVPALILNLLAVGLGFATLKTAIDHRTTQKSSYFIWAVIVICLYSLASLLGLFAQNEEAAFMALRFAYAGLPSIGPLFFLFWRSYCNLPWPKRRAFWLFLLPAVCSLLVLSWPASNLYFTGAGFLPQPVPFLQLGRGPLFYAGAAYNIVFIAGGVYTLLRYFPRNTNIFFVQFALFLLAGVLPMVVILLFRTFQYAAPYYVAPFLLSLSVALVGYYILRYRQPDWLPYARDMVLEKMGDGYVMLDMQNCFLDANAEAKRYFPPLNTLPFGSPIGLVPDFPEKLAECESETTDFTLCADENCRSPRHLRVSTSTIFVQEEAVCRCMMFYDANELFHLMEELQQLATYDALTGLYNRATFYQTANQSLLLARRNHSAASALMLDIDLFKQVNDNHGHACGDMALQKVAQSVQKRLRSVDICGRYGGEELCVYLPGANLENAMLVAEQLRRIIENTPLSWGQAMFNVTVSIGVACLDCQRHPTLDSLVADADTAMYAAKAAGRNRVMPIGAEGDAPPDTLSDVSLGVPS